MEQVRTDKMKDMPVNKLMLAMGIPIVLSMILQAVYNIVDSAFVSNMAEHGEDALNALTLAFPIAEILSAVISVILFKRLYNKKIKTME